VDRSTISTGVTRSTTNQERTPTRRLQPQPQTQISDGAEFALKVYAIAWYSPPLGNVYDSTRITQPAILSTKAFNQGQFAKSGWRQIQFVPGAGSLADMQPSTVFLNVRPGHGAESPGVFGLAGATEFAAYVDVATGATFTLQLP
jgi:hypothetical protein